MLSFRHALNLVLTVFKIIIRQTYPLPVLLFTVTSYVFFFRKPEYEFCWNWLFYLVTCAVEPTGDTLTNTSETDVASAGVWKRPITGI